LTAIDPGVAKSLQQGLVIPACPLALTAERRFNERRQRALFRYYLEAGAGGLAVGVHTTQFAIRDPKHGLFRPLLELAVQEMSRADSRRKTPVVRIAGICGPSPAAVAEATLIRDSGFHAGLLNLSALREEPEEEVVAHCRRVTEVIPLFGFYLQPSMGGRVLPYSFWRRFAEIDNVVAIKVAPFDRYRSIDVVRAVAESGRGDIALYTGNDDNIVLDLLTAFRFRDVNGKAIERRIVGGLLGHWAVWTRRAVEILQECHQSSTNDSGMSPELLRLSVEVTDANAAIFDAANNFAGCIPGVHEILRRQGLLEGIWCLDPNQTLSPGQAEEIDRVCQAYPHLADDAFVHENLDHWLSA
jgi:dihydrodipicolinate synthase/N-acetylneuraminate lyase